MALKMDKDIGFGFLVEGVYMQIREANYFYQHNIWEVTVNNYYNEASRQAFKLKEQAIEIMQTEEYKTLDTVDQKEIEFTANLALLLPKIDVFKVNLTLEEFTQDAIIKACYEVLKTMAEFVGAEDC